MVRRKDRIWIFGPLAFLGVVVPYSQLLPWLTEHGLDRVALFRELFSTRVGAVFNLGLAVRLLGCGRSDSAYPPQQASPLEVSRLVGVWAHDSYTVTDREGLAGFPYGQDPVGQLIYTEDGRMSAQMMRPDFALESIADVEAVTAVREMGLSAFFAYWGTYSVDEGAATVTHHLTGCLYPDWVGADQVRNFRFDDEDTLVIWAELAGVGQPGDLYELTWKRAR